MAVELTWTIYESGSARRSEGRKFHSIPSGYGIVWNFEADTEKSNVTRTS